MGESLAYGVGAVAGLLVVDELLRRARRTASATGAGLRLLQAARLVAFFLLAATLSTSCRAGEGAGLDVAWMVAFGVFGLLAIELAQALGFVAIRGLAAAVRVDNLAAAVAAAGHVLAVGVLVANVAGGATAAELLVAALSFAVGQATLLLLLWLFRRLTAYDDRGEILAGNVAAGLSHAGLTIALALLIAHATDGPFVGVWPAVRDYGVALAEGLVIWPLRQLLVQCVLFRARPRLGGGELDAAIAAGDLGAGALEAAAYLGLVLFVRSVVS
jgi:uncharacterized membrane protein YjfL (UPF0719 family)